MAVLERVFRSHDGLPLWVVERAAHLARAVGRISVGRRGFGTGFLVAPQLVLTCHHVVPDAVMASQSTLELDYYIQEDGSFAQVTAVALDPSSMFFADAALDFVFIGLKHPLKDRPVIAMTTRGHASPGTRVSLIHHPRAGPMRIALGEGEVVAVPDGMLHHTVDTHPGSAGAPLLDESLRLIGLHHAAGPRVQRADGTEATTLRSLVNEAIDTGAILQVVEKGFRSLLAMLDVAEEWEQDRPKAPVRPPEPRRAAAPPEVIDARAPQVRDSVFISYARGDQGKRKWRERLRTFLMPFGEELDVWDDSRIQTGAQWRTEIEFALKRARVAVLLVGPSFLASEFIAKHELPPLLEAAEKEGAVILPLITNHCSYERSALGKYEAFNDPKKPLESLEYPDQNERMQKFAEEIDDAFRGRRQN